LKNDVEGTPSLKSLEHFINFWNKLYFLYRYNNFIKNIDIYILMKIYIIKIENII